MLPRLEEAILGVVDEEGNIHDRASDALRRSRRRVADLERRARRVLNATGRTVTQHEDRLCVILHAGESSDAIAGLVVGSTETGGWIVEPNGAVPVYNSLVQVCVWEDWFPQ